ncbi:MAG: recombination-associated protein RdgC [Verrucomicrobiota bacterium]
MPFDTGTVNFQVCKLPEGVPKDILSHFPRAAGGPLENIRDEPRLGWVSGRHLLETRIDEETARCGGYLHLCLREAVRKIPTSLFKAQCRMAELKIMADEGKEELSRKRRQQIRQEVHAQLLPEMPPQLKGINFVIDHNTDRLYIAATSTKQLDTFLEFFIQNVGLVPTALFPNELAEELKGDGASQVQPLVFSEQVEEASYDLRLGHTFLTWLWYKIYRQNGKFTTKQLGEIHIGMDGPIVLVAPEEEQGQELTLRKGAPPGSSEAKKALEVGKKLRRAKFMIGCRQNPNAVWEGSIDMDNCSFRSFKLPESESLDTDSVFEDRINRIHDLYTVFRELFTLFLDDVTEPARLKEVQKDVYQWVKE